MAGQGKPLKRPKRAQVIFGRNLWAIVDFINAFLNVKVVREDPPEVLISDKNIIIKIGKTSGGISGSSSYRGEYSPDGVTTFGDGPFLFGQIVRVSPTNALSVPVVGALGIIPGVYICVQDNPTSIDTPNHPLSDGGESPFWHWLSTWPSLSTTCDEDGSNISVVADQQELE